MSNSRIWLGALALFALNSFVCGQLYFTEWLDQRASIEGAYIGLAQYIQTHPGEYRWFPHWYNGIPFQNTYPPLLHFTVAWTSSLTGWSVALAYHRVCALFYALGPVTLFLFVWRLRASLQTAWLAGLLYSAAPFSIWFMASVHRDMGTWLGPRRLQALIGWGEGPNVTALALVPVAWLFVLEAMRRPRGWRIATAALACAAVALTNWLGCFAMAAGVLLLCIAEKPAALWRACLIAALAYAVASPWIPPSTIATVQRNAQILGNYPMTWRNWIALAALLAVTLALRRWGFVPLLALLMTVLPLADEYFKFALVPQAFRYHLVLEMAWSTLIATALAKLAKPHWTAVAVTLCAIAACVAHRDYSRILILPMKASEAWEFQAGRWVEEQRPQARTYTTGSVRLWWLAFSQNPQMDGGFFQGLTNRRLLDANWNIPRADPRVAWLWLRLMGVRVVVAGTEKTLDQYNDWKNTESLRRSLTVLWDSDHDIIFEVPVPPNRRGLAFVVDRNDVPAAPVNVERYVAAMDSPAHADAPWEWGSAHSARVKTKVREGETLSVLVSYHRGWHAAVAGRPQEIREDALGHMAIDVTGCAEGCTVELLYDGGIEMKIARWTQRLALLAMLWIALRR